MDKTEFLHSVEERVDYILEDRLFKNNIAQIRAKATLSQITDQQLPDFFKFDKNFVINYARFLLSSLNYFSSESEIDAKVNDKMLNAAYSAAEAFEFLYQLLENEEKEQSLLNACIAYHTAGYQANAIFLARKLKKQGIPPEDAFYATLYQNQQQTLLYFLERRIPNLIVQTGQAINQLKESQQDLINRIEERWNVTDIYDFTSQLGLHKALNNFAFYTISGNSQFFEESETELKRVNRITSDIGDFELNFLISNLIAGLKLFRERSTWENIRKNGFDEKLDFRWKLYLRNSALGTLRDGKRSNSIVEFWKSQIIALEKGLITSDSGFVVQMPTSAGKTKVAELAILSELIENPGFKCIYLAPFRALAYEIEEALSSAFAYIGFHVSSVVGSFETDELENHLMQTSDVIVTTPEKMDLLFRSQPEFFDKVALVVVDEGHIIEQIERGPKLELLLTRLKRKVARTEARFLFISAVVPEITAKEFALWLTGSGENVLSVKWRPTRQLLGRFEWHKESGTIYYPELEIEGGKAAFIPKMIEKQTASLPAKKVTAAKLALAFAKQGPVLVFCGMPQYVEPVAKELINELNQQEQHTANLLPNYGDDLLSIEVAKEWLGEEHDLIKYLRRGIGIHYGPMPEALRRAIEDEFRSGKLNILVATNTLGQGVNLPIKTVIIHTLNIGFRDGRAEYLEVRDFWNICGRAGRALHDTEGQIVFITHKPKDMKLFNYYKNKDNIESVKGRLYEILRTLLQRRISEDDIDELFSENLIDTHLLSMLVEESVDTPDEEILRNFLDDSLVKIQAFNSGLDMEPLIKASTIVSRRIYTKVEDEVLRKIFAKTGLSIKSCEKLSEYIQENIVRFVDFYEHSGDSNKEDIVKLIHESLIKLHEMEEEKKIKYKEGAGDYDLLQSWINLKSIPEMALKFTQGEEVEKVAEYINKKFVYKLSWGTNAFTKILAYKMGKNLEDLPLFLRYLPSMIKFGVNTHYACWAMGLGLLSRNVAHKVGEAYREEQGESEDFNDFVEWFKTLTKEKFGKLGMSELQTKTLERRVAKLTVYNIAEYDEIRNKIKKVGIIAKIKGLEYEDRLRNFKEVEEGSVLHLERDYLNKYDVNAIKIYYKDKELGFISSERARILAPLMDFGERFKVILESKRVKNIKIIEKKEKHEA